MSRASLATPHPNTFNSAPTLRNVAGAVRCNPALRRRNSETPMSRTLTSRVTRLSAVALIAGAATFGVAAPALAHDELIGTELVADSADGSLESIRLTFSNSIIETGTEIVVTGPGGSDALDGAPAIAGPDVTQPLAADLSAGNYDAAWRVVSSDGHPIEGTFAFTVAADGTATMAEAAPAGDAEHGADADHEHADGETADHEHAEGDDHAEGAADTETEGGMPVGGVIAISVAAIAAAGGAATAAVVAQRRRTQAMGGQASSDTVTEAGPDAPSTTDGEDQR